MKGRILAALLAAFFVVAGATYAQQGQGNPPPPAPSAATQPPVEKPPSCPSGHRFRTIARHAYRRAHVSRRVLRRLDAIRACSPTARAARLLRFQHRQGRARLLRAELAAVTPYGPCPGIAGKWAVPCDIIQGEAHGGWTVVNYRGCVGPYQFCGWRVPWPVRTLADKLAHHRMAARLWAGGKGCPNWSQTSSQC